ncbi:hypothetical protein LCGC14_1059670 [marine sediment metagenome]|uniref:Uncharacterized protein n=1 Tax=marine sediment metagenome TaxID=412755 RepID=A0A0F9MLN7_9ZZZZ
MDSSEKENYAELLFAEEAKNRQLQAENKRLADAVERLQRSRIVGFDTVALKAKE